MNMKLIVSLIIFNKVFNSFDTGFISKKYEKYRNQEITKTATI